MRGPTRRRDSLAILAAGIARHFLALGDEGAISGLFRLASEHVPSVVTMREPSIGNSAAGQRRSDPPL